MLNVCLYHSRSILEKEGPRSLFRGLGPNLVGVAPSRYRDICGCIWVSLGMYGSRAHKHIDHWRRFNLSYIGHKRNTLICYLQPVNILLTLLVLNTQYFVVCLYLSKGLLSIFEKCRPLDCLQSINNCQWLHFVIGCVSSRTMDIMFNSDNHTLLDPSGQTLKPSLDMAVMINSPKAVWQYHHILYS